MTLGVQLLALNATEAFIVVLKTTVSLLTVTTGVGACDGMWSNPNTGVEKSIKTAKTTGCSNLIAMFLMLVME